MKKPDKELQLLLNRRAERRIRRQYYAKKAAKARRARRRLGAKSRDHASKTVKIPAPAAFRMAYHDVADRYALLHFLARIESVLARGSKVRIFFEKTKTLNPDGTLLFVATVESYLAEYPGRITCDYPADEVVEQLFQHIGLLQKLGNSPRKTITADTVKHWHFLQGTVADPSGFTQLFASFANQLGAQIKAGLYEGMSEAITNVVQHAYEGVPPERLAAGGRWWMFAQQKGTTLDVAICDLGIGIPKSLLMKPQLTDVLPRLLRSLRKRRATGLIEVAVESGRSRTRMPHRGKGLPDMLTFSKQCNIGGFLIQSDTGVFTYMSQTKREKAHDHNIPIQGTLIQWQIELSK